MNRKLRVIGTNSALTLIASIVIPVVAHAECVMNISLSEYNADFRPTIKKFEQALINNGNGIEISHIEGKQEGIFLTFERTSNSLEMIVNKNVKENKDLKEKPNLEERKDLGGNCGLQCPIEVSERYRSYKTVEIGWISIPITKKSSHDVIDKSDVEKEISKVKCP